MKSHLISCGNCGVVLDTKRIPKPDIWSTGGVLIRGEAAWNDNTGRYEPLIACPVCRTAIFYDTGDRQ